MALRPRAVPPGRCCHTRSIRSAHLGSMPTGQTASSCAIHRPGGRHDRSDPSVSPRVPVPASPAAGTCTAQRARRRRRSRIRRLRGGAGPSRRSVVRDPTLAAPRGQAEHAGPAAVCLRCEGWSEAEVNALFDERICTFGCTTMGVGRWSVAADLDLHDRARTGRQSRAGPRHRGARAGGRGRRRSCRAGRRRWRAVRRGRRGDVRGRPDRSDPRRPSGARRARPRGRRPELLPLGRSSDAGASRAAGRASGTPASPPRPPS
jgi:hypothetical protein